MRATHITLTAILIAGNVGTPQAAGSAGRHLPPPIVPPPPVSVSPASALPLFFEPNRGQAAAGVEFLARTSGYLLTLSSTTVVFKASSTAVPAELRMELAGARPDVRLQAGERAEGTSNYIRSSRDRWVVAVGHYRRVRAAAVYPGIDLDFRVAGGALEYDFIIAPEADPEPISWLITGADEAWLDETGDLVAQLGDARLTQSAPVAYQEIDGRRRYIDAGFELRRAARDEPRSSANGGRAPGAGASAGGGPAIEVSFSLGAYDHREELLIDPAIGFSTYLGGMASEDVPHLAIDGAGNLYVVGTTGSTDFPAPIPQEAAEGAEGTEATEAGGAARAAPSTLAGDVDAFVAKLDAGGSRLLQTTYIGGAGTDRGTGIAVAADGGVWVTGQTSSADFPTLGAVQADFAGGTDAFIVKLGADGAAIEYGTFLGGSDQDAGGGLAVDASGAVHVTGTTGSTDFPTVRPIQGELGAPSDAFVLTLDPTGAEIVYSTYLGGAGGSEAGFAIASDPSGAVYLTGTTDGVGFPTVKPLQRAPGGAGDAFVAKVDAEGAAFVFATLLGGAAADAGLSIAVDEAGFAYVTGQTSSDDFPTHRAIQPQRGGGADAFVAKLSPAGEGLVFSTYLGGAEVEVGGGVAIDGAGNVHVTGMTGSSDFPTVDSLQPFFGGGSDVFVSRLDETGNGLTYSTYFGGAGAEAGVGIVVDGAGNAYVAGQTSSPDFPTYNPLQDTLHGPRDVFVAKYCLSLVFPRQIELGSAGGANSAAVTTAAGCAWFAFSDDDWIAVTSPSVVAGSGDVQFALAPNGSGRARAGAINVGGTVLTITQAPATDCDFRISPGSDNFYSIGGVGRVSVQTTADCAWTAVSNTDWITVTNGTRGTGEGVVSYTVEENNTGRQRSGTITIAGQSFVVFDWIREEQLP